MLLLLASAGMCGRRGSQGGPQLQPHRRWQGVSQSLFGPQMAHSGEQGKGEAPGWPWGPSMGHCSGLGGRQPDTTPAVKASFFPGGG